MDTLGGVFLTTLWIFLLFAYLMVLFHIFGDIFRDGDLSGWAKAGWIIFLIFFPFLAALIYLLARGDGMQKRSMQDLQNYKQAQDEYIRSVASTGTDSAAQIQQAHELLQQGAISADEFAALKAKALS